MKRSEMLYSIQREIELRSDRFGNLTESPSKLALSILDELEELGMLPPCWWPNDGGWDINEWEDE